jgi:hypothetical protein
MTVKYLINKDKKHPVGGSIPKVAGLRLTPQGRVEIVCMLGFGELKTIMLDPENITEIIIHENCPYTNTMCHP